MPKKKAANTKRRRERVILTVDLFVDERRNRYERATELSGLREVSEWVRRVLDDAANKLIEAQKDAAGRHQ